MSIPLRRTRLARLFILVFCSIIAVVGFGAMGSAKTGLIVFFPPAAYSAADAFGYVVATETAPGVASDLTATGAMVIDLPPTAVNDSATVAEDAASTSVDVLANDTDTDGGPRSVASVTQPTNGAAVIIGGGTGLTYAPNPNYCNTPPGTTLDTFTYTLSPGSSTGTVTLTVTCVDDSPIAVADAATVLEDSGWTAINVLANDTDIDGGPKSITTITQPASGSVTFTGEGLSYRPNTNYCNDPPGTGLSTFTYTLTPGGSSTTVTVTVTCVADPPIVTTTAATFVTANSARLNGSVNPDGATTTGWFRYSTANPGTCSDSFGTRAPASGGTFLGSGTSPAAYTQSITGLAAGQTYYYCAIASNLAGAAFGGVVSFKTYAPPTVSKSFVNTAQSNSNNTSLNGTARLTITITNPAGNNGTLSGLAITDTFPAGLEVNAPLVTSNTCGGTFAPTSGATSITFGGGALGVGDQCTIFVVVKATTAGVITNTTGNISSTEGGQGLTASGVLNVFAPPVISKSFSPAIVPVGGTSTLTVTITNPAGNPGPLTGVGFTDVFPAGLLVAATPALTNTCGGTPAGGTAGANDLGLTGGAVGASPSNTCTLSVNVTSSGQGPFINTTGTVFSSNGGNGNTAAATLQTRIPVLAVTKTHTLPFVQGGSASWSIQVTNNGATAADSTSGTTTVSDTFPAGYTLGGVSAPGWTCMGSNTVTCTSSQVVTGAGGNFPPINLTVAVPANSAVSVSNTAKVFGGGDPVHTSLATAASGTDNVTVGQVPASIAIVAGNNQSAPANTPFAANLSVVVKDAGNVGVSGISVTFTAPPAEPTGYFPDQTKSQTVVTDASGIATATTLKAGRVAGGPYLVSAAAGSLSQNFSLTNTAGPGVGAPRADFDGDGRTDVSVFRPAEGNWYINGSTSGFAAANWGVSSDKLIPGDFDGDGTTDLAVWRPTTDAGVADFYILNSNGSTISGYAWGSPGDIPMAGDYSGDGITDVAIFRPSTSEWWIWIRQTQSVQAFQFGASGDVPMVMDYNGDGKTDLAVYRPGDRNWYMSSASGVPAQNFSAVQFGVAGDVLVPADYDGDNKDDVAVFRPSNGTWYIMRSLDGGLMQVQFGISIDIAVPGDYDGDGKDDIAVYRPSDGTWYMNNSSTGFAAQAFGISTDVPVPAAYHP